LGHADGSARLHRARAREALKFRIEQRAKNFAHPVSAEV